MDNSEWQTDIEKWLTDYLFKIEWHYGENRAPFVWPPQFRKRKPLFGQTMFSCTLISEDDKTHPVTMTAYSPEGLLEKVRETVNNCYGSMDRQCE